MTTAQESSPEWEMVPLSNRRKFLTIASMGAACALQYGTQKTVGLENPVESMTYIEKYSLGHNVTYQLIAKPAAARLSSPSSP